MAGGIWLLPPIVVACSGSIPKWPPICTGTVINPTSAYQTLSAAGGSFRPLAPSVLSQYYQQIKFNRAESNCYSKLNKQMICNCNKFRVQLVSDLNGSAYVGFSHVTGLIYYRNTAHCAAYSVPSYINKFHQHWEC